MTADEFLEWALRDEGNERCELVAGEVVAMAPERAAHAETKAFVWQALHRAIRERGLHCQAFPDGMAVQVDASTVYEPDALVRCGERLPDDAIKVIDPMIVVEVLSPSTRARDAGAKLEDYFRLRSVRHYLLVKTETRSVIHHRRTESGAIETFILREGALDLEPPGIALTVESFFA